LGSLANPLENEIAIHNDTQVIKKIILAVFLITTPPFYIPQFFNFFQTLDGSTDQSDKIARYPIWLDFLNDPRIMKGVTILMAPSSPWGQWVMQQPQNQHSSGYFTMGGFPFSGFISKASVIHTSTHLPHPSQMFSSK